MSAISFMKKRKLQQAEQMDQSVQTDALPDNSPADLFSDLPEQPEGIDLQKALEERGDILPQSNIEFWKQEIKMNPPTISLSKEFVEETKQLSGELEGYSREDVRRAMFRAANDLSTLFTKEIALSNISRADKEYIKNAFMLARDSLTYNENADLEFQLLIFYEFAFLGYARIALSRGLEGTTLKEINSQRVYSEQNLRQSKSKGGDKSGFMDRLSGFFGGGGDNPLSGLMSGGYL